MNLVSQIIQRNMHHLPRGETGLWINPLPDLAWREAADLSSSLKLFCQQFGAYSFHKSAGAKVEFGTFPHACQQDNSRQRYAWIILNLPREKALLGMLLDCVVGLLADDGEVWLAGENKAGIKSANKLLETRFTEVSKLDNARHCTLFVARKPVHQQPFSLQDYQQKWLLDYAGGELKVASYPGVFAHGRLDDGTALLLSTIAGLKPAGEILDFGCGAGVIGASVMAGHEDVHVTFLDSSALALQACEDTLAANGLHGQLLASDGLCGVSQSYDMVISNPPIHAGVKTDNRMSLRLLEDVHTHIRPGGELILVANRHLPYENWLAQHFQHIEALAGNRNFKVIAAKCR